MIKAGGERENKAVGLILNRNRQKIKSLVLKLQGSEEDAKDVLMEGLVDLIFTINRDKYKDDSSIDTFLYRICTFLWYKKFNKLVKAQDHNKQIDIPEKDLNTPEVIFIDEELKQKLQELAIFLGEDCFQILHLSAQGYSTEEILEKMANFNSPQAIMNKKSKCKKKLAEEIDNKPDLKKYLKELRSFYFNDK